MKKTHRLPREVVVKAIVESGGTLVHAAALLQISRPTLYAWIYHYELEKLAGISLGTELYSARFLRMLGVKSAAEITDRIPAMETEQIVQINVRLPEWLWKGMRIEALRREIPVGNLVEASFKQTLGVEGPGQRPKRKAKA